MNRPAAAAGAPTSEPRPMSLDDFKAVLSTQRPSIEKVGEWVFACGGGYRREL